MDGLGLCVTLCPRGRYMDNDTKKCEPVCTRGYAEETSRFCVVRCFNEPLTYAHVANKTCVRTCRSATDTTLFADNNTNYCVVFNNCTRSPATYSDPYSASCVLFCPEGLYAEDTTFTCSTGCATGFADNYTRKCVPGCPASEQTYADPTTSKCVKVCPDGYYAN